jgi:predicted nucleic acid-binding protein
MVLVDTSVWVSHLRATDTELVSLLAAEKVACHPLPPATTAQDHEVLSLIEARRLMGRGIGLVDVHLLASALLSPMPIWTRDRRLREAAVEMGISFD